MYNVMIELREAMKEIKMLKGENAKLAHELAVAQTQVKELREFCGITVVPKKEEVVKKTQEKVVC